MKLKILFLSTFIVSLLVFVQCNSSPDSSPDSFQDASPEFSLDSSHDLLPDSLSDTPYHNVLLGGKPAKDPVTVSYEVVDNILNYKVTVNTSSTYTHDIWSANGGDNSAYFIVFGDDIRLNGSFEIFYDANNYPYGNKTYKGSIELGDYKNYEMTYGGFYLTPGPVSHGESDVSSLKKQRF